MISGLSSFTLTVIVPSLPAMATRYGASYGEVQILVSAFLIGLAVSQPLWGHIADVVGRRPVILTGFSILFAASLATLAEPALEWMAVLRLLQAIGASAGTVVARAIIRDRFAAADAARAMSWVSIGLGAAPIVAPMIGGALLLAGEPTLVFAVVAIPAAALVLFLRRGLEETLSADAVRPTWSSLLSSIARLLANRGFVGYTAVYGFFQGGFFSFLAVGAAVFQDSFNLGPAVFGAVWGVMGSAYVIGAAAGGRLASGPRHPLLLPICVLGSLGLALLLAALDRAIGAHLVGVLLPLFLMMALTGAATPLVMAGAVYQVPGLAGTAAGLSSALGMVMGSSFTVAAGKLYQADFSPVALLILGAATATALAWLSIRRLG